jgi:hypothetical protein
MWKTWWKVCLIYAEFASFFSSNSQENAYKAFIKQNNISQNISHNGQFGVIFDAKLQRLSIQQWHWGENLMPRTKSMLLFHCPKYVGCICICTLSIHIEKEVGKEGQLANPETPDSGGTIDWDSLFVEKSSPNPRH